jgi:hypothetical protein
MSLLIVENNPSMNLCPHYNTTLAERLLPLVCTFGAFQIHTRLQMFSLFRWALPPQGQGLLHWIQLLEVLPKP